MGWWGMVGMLYLLGGPVVMNGLLGKVEMPGIITTTTHVGRERYVSR